MEEIYGMRECIFLMRIIILLLQNTIFIDVWFLNMWKSIQIGNDFYIFQRILRRNIQTFSFETTYMIVISKFVLLKYVHFHIFS